MKAKEILIQKIDKLCNKFIIDCNLIQKLSQIENKENIQKALTEIETLSKEIDTFSQHQNNDNLLIHRKEILSQLSQFISSYMQNTINYQQFLFGLKSIHSQVNPSQIPIGEKSVCSQSSVQMDINPLKQNQLQQFQSLYASRKVKLIPSPKRNQNAFITQKKSKKNIKCLTLSKNDLNQQIKFFTQNRRYHSVAQNNTSPSSKSFLNIINDKTNLTNSRAISLQTVKVKIEKISDNFQKQEKTIDKISLENIDVSFRSSIHSNILKDSKKQNEISFQYPTNEKTAQQEILNLKKQLKEALILLKHKDDQLKQLQYENNKLKEQNLNQTLQLQKLDLANTSNIQFMGEIEINDKDTELKDPKSSIIQFLSNPENQFSIEGIMNEGEELSELHYQSNIKNIETAKMCLNPSKSTVYDDNYMYIVCEQVEKQPYFVIFLEVFDKGQLENFYEQIEVILIDKLDAIITRVNDQKNKFQIQIQPSHSGIFTFLKIQINADSKIFAEFSIPLVLYRFILPAKQEDTSSIFESNNLIQKSLKIPINKNWITDPRYPNLFNLQQLLNQNIYEGKLENIISLKSAYIRVHINDQQMQIEFLDEKRIFKQIDIQNIFKDFQAILTLK